MTPEVKSSLEKFVCLLYGYKQQESVNMVRKSIFLQKYANDKKSADLTLLPPCESNLSLHIDRANYVANLFCSAKRLMMCLDDPCEHGWNVDGAVRWDETYFPDDVSNVLVNNEDNGDEVYNDYDNDGSDDYESDNDDCDTGYDDYDE